VIADLLAYLDRVNQHIQNYATSTGALFTDIHRHFLVHVLSAPARERWYWAPNPIDPSAHGASEIRRLWLDALQAEGLV
jgi:hypothetical protein